MRIFFDAEFYEDGNTIELISIGMVREDGATYYCETPDSNLLVCRSEWLRKNVKPHLTCKRVSRHIIAEDIVKFVGFDPEFWAYYADYDWVVLCQLYGTMVDLPKGWPMFCMDLKQLCVSLGNPRLPARDDGHDHHALADAQWNKYCWEFLQRMMSDE